MNFWTLAFPNKQGIRKSAEWKALGFQGTDPASDFRGSGIFGLNSLIYFATNYAHAFTKMLQQSEDEDCYPFAIAGLNVTMLIFELLGWGFKTPGKTTAKSPVTYKNLITILFIGDDTDLDKTIRAFNELYCLTFATLDKVWHEVNATYFEFPKVLLLTQEKIEKLLQTIDSSTILLHHCQHFFSNNFH